MPGSVISSTYCACPVTLSRPSLRGTDTPTMHSPVIEIDYRIPPARLPPPFPPARLSEKVALRKHRAPPQIRGFHHSAQRFAQIGRQRIPVVQSLGCHLKCFFLIKYDQVRIAACRTATFASVAPRQSRLT